MMKGGVSSKVCIAPALGMTVKPLSVTVNPQARS